MPPTKAVPVRFNTLGDVLRHLKGVHPRRIPVSPPPGAATVRAEMARKRRDYFGAGTRLVWQVNPRTRTVDVFTAPDEYTTLTEADTLDGTDVLPGFTLPVRSLFVNQPPVTAKRKKNRR
jgi:hypothetical protein